MAIPQQECTVDGIEQQVQSNHLGHFYLTSLLAATTTSQQNPNQQFCLAPNARIINVSSSAHTLTAPTNGLDFDYFWQGEPNYQPWKSYGQSKLANILFTQELQRRMDASTDPVVQSWSTVALHPGVIVTDLWRSSVNPHLREWASSATELWNQQTSGISSSTLPRIASLLAKTPAQGANTQVYLAVRQDNNDDDDIGYAILVFVEKTRGGDMDCGFPRQQLRRKVRNEYDSSA